MSPETRPSIAPAQLASLAPDVQELIRGIVDHYELRLRESEARIQAMQVEMAAMRAEIASLKDQLQSDRKTPHNSSLPPSSEHPHAKPVSTTTASQKKRGGQPGHPKHERKLIPVELCHAVHPLKPSCCRGCGSELAGDDPQPLRHQVWEIPQPQPLVTEYVRHRLTCPGCGQTTCAELPEGVPEHTSGPRLVAVTGLLMALFRQSKRRTALALGELFGVPVSPGLVVKLQQRLTDALAPSYEEMRTALPQTKVCNCDETAMKEGKKKSWLWTVVTATFTVFAIRLTRSADVIETLLGRKYKGVVGCDRYAGYNHFNDRRQICWAHLKRDFQAMIDAGGQARKIGDRLMDHLHHVFDHWHRYRSGQTTRRTMQTNIKSLYHTVWQTLEDGERCSHGPTAATCRDLFDRFDQLWMFRDHPGVDPTNNVAERSLRSAVIWRKLSFGTQSDQGSRFVETMLSVIETCRQQNRNAFDFLTAATEAALNGQEPPKLLRGV